MVLLNQLLVFLPKIAGIDVGELKGVVELCVRDKILGTFLQGPVCHVKGVAHNLESQNEIFACAVDLFVLYFKKCSMSSMSERKMKYSIFCILVLCSLSWLYYLFRLRTSKYYCL